MAIVGSTGSGKSTWSILFPLLRCHRGRVTIDGCDVRDLTLASLRRHIGIVMQETFLSPLPLGKILPTDGPMPPWKKLRPQPGRQLPTSSSWSCPKAMIRWWEREELGFRGQRQRVAIARALLADPRILILDDSTSSVDLETEREIQEALQRLMEGKDYLHHSPAAVHSAAGR